MPVDFFEIMPLFQSLTAEQIYRLRPLFDVGNFSADTVIFEQGSPANYLYTVITGEVVVNFKPDDGPAITVARIHSGGIVGWSAVLSGHKYTSAAVTTAYTQFLRVRGDDLRSLCEQNPDIGGILLNNLAGIIAERISKTHPQVLDLLRMGLFNTTPIRR